jgi:hypothetical protein
VPPIPNQIYDHTHPPDRTEISASAAQEERNARPRGKRNRRDARARETEGERRGGEAEARRRRVPAMERCHPSEVYELFVRHMNTPR